MKNLSLVEKYRIKNFKDIVGQDSIVEELKKFFQEFPKKKGLILYGPAGTGKTSLALASAKEFNREILELNASDLRNKDKLEQILKPASEQQSLFKESKVLLMDEADGVTGREDAGGIAELLRILETTSYPVILTCNDVWQSKLSPIRAKCKVVELKPLSTIQIIETLKKIAEKEKINHNLKFLNQIAIKSKGDMRAAINDLQSYSFSDDLVVDLTEKRDVEDNIFNILRRLFKERNNFHDIFDNTSLSLDEILLWIEENIPKEYKNEALAKAYASLSNADVFRGRIYTHQSWRFLIYQNIFQSSGIAYSKKEPSISFTKYE